MGEAKRRGTFVARKAESIARQKAKDEEQSSNTKQTKRITPRSVRLIAFLAASKMLAGYK